MEFWISFGVLALTVVALIFRVEYLAVQIEVQSEVIKLLKNGRS